MPDLLAHALGATALALIMLLGFAAQRGGLCTVNAIAEVFTSRRARLLASFFKAALWAAGVFGIVTLLLPMHARGFEILAPESISVAGAFVFGIGAAINGACAMSTLQRLADGDAWMAMTLLGMALGLASWSVLASAFPVAHARELPVAWTAMTDWTAAVAVAICVLGAIEAVRLWRSRERGPSFARLVTSPHYRLSTAALVIGICGGLLYGLKGAWSYTTWLHALIRSARSEVETPAAFGLLLFIALIAGMVLAAVLRRSFRLRSVPVGIRVRRLTGGIIMGFGAGAIPGGNEALLLVGLPTLSLWALALYGALLVGIAIGMLGLRALGASIAAVDCAGDVCREERWGHVAKCEDSARAAAHP